MKNDENEIGVGFIGMRGREKSSKIDSRQSSAGMCLRLWGRGKRKIVFWKLLMFEVGVID